MELTSNAFTRKQKFLVILLALLQFTVILDFMIIAPLGPILMPQLAMSPSQFGLVVSAYAFSAGLSGILAAGFADKFDRKNLLLFFYFGFILGTVFCALASSYIWLLAARIFTGLFGGVIGSVILAIATDVFPQKMRGRVMGILQTGFSASQILGIPAGLFFSTLWGWHAPFVMIVIISTLFAALVFFYLEPVVEHLKYPSQGSAFHHLISTVMTPRYVVAFTLTALLVLGGYMIMPFSSAFTVHNLGIEVSRLPFIYLITGVFTILVAPLVGKMTDKFGSFRVFLFGAVLTIIMVLIYTHLGITPMWVVVTVNSVMFLGIFSRMIPAQAMVSSIPAPASRGAFMAVNASLQQVAGGLGSMLAGFIVVEGAGGLIENFDIVGYILVFTTVVSTFIVYHISKSIPKAE